MITKEQAQKTIAQINDNKANIWLQDAEKRIDEELLQHLVAYLPLPGLPEAHLSVITQYIIDKYTEAGWYCERYKHSQECGPKTEYLVVKESKPPICWQRLFGRKI